MPHRQICMQQVAGEELGELHKYVNTKAKRKYIVGKINRTNSGLTWEFVVEIEGRRFGFSLEYFGF